MASKAKARTDEEEQTPLKSSELLDKMFGLTPAHFGKLARDLVETVEPIGQGLNSIRLADNILQKGASHPHYEIAKKFQNLWYSNRCYMCGMSIETKPKHMEVEHICPLTEGMAFEFVITKSVKEFKDNIDEIANSNAPEFYFLEYAKSHTCCNQAKSNTSFLKFNGNPKTGGYSINKQAIKNVLTKIWDSTVGGDGFQEKPHACGNKKLISDLKRVEGGKSKWIDTQIESITDNQVEPIVDKVSEFIGDVGLPFAQLVFLSNQALSVNPEVWDAMGVRWRGQEISKDDFLTSIVSIDSTATYKNDIEPIIDIIVKMISEQNTFNSDDYIKRMYTRVLEKTNKRGSSRKYDTHVLSSIINNIINTFKKEHYDAVTANNTLQPVVDDTRPLLFGIEYAQLLINAQDAEFKYNSDMIPLFHDMIKNVNNYTLIYITILLIYINNNNGRLPTTEDSIIELNNQIEYYTSIYGGYNAIHFNFVQRLAGFNFVVQIREENFYSFDDLSVYGNFVLLEHYFQDAAKAITRLCEKEVNKYVELESLADVSVSKEVPLAEAAAFMQGMKKDTGAFAKAGLEPTKITAPMGTDAISEAELQASLEEIEKKAVASGDINPQLFTRRGGSKKRKMAYSRKTKKNKQKQSRKMKPRKIRKTNYEKW